METTRNDLVSIIIPTLNEEENISRLVLSIYEQEYRPIEVVVVDGGSKDSTVSIIKDLMNKLNISDFKIAVFNEKDYGSFHSQPNARNIGIKNSNGDLLFFIDADFILIDNRTVSAIKEALTRHPWVGVKIKPIIDNWLEKHLAIDESFECGGNIHRFGAVRRELFKHRLFNPILGVGEDRYFFEHLGIEIKIIDVYVGRHYPHSFGDYSKQKKWYGRTVWYYLKTFPSFRNIFNLLLSPVAYMFLLPLAVLSLFWNWIFSAVLFSIFLAVIIRAILRSSEKTPSRVAYEVFSKTVGNCLYVYGVFKGLLQLTYKHSTESSRC